jgi:hypothetical protein
MSIGRSITTAFLSPSFKKRAFASLLIIRNVRLGRQRAVGADEIDAAITAASMTVVSASAPPHKSEYAPCYEQAALTWLTIC